MSAKRAKTAPQRAKPPERRGLLESVRPWLLAAMTAAVVARPLVPSEGVSWLGDDLPFDLLLIVTAAGYFLWAAARGGLLRPLSLADGFVGALVAACVVSALVGASAGNPRLTINMLWQWVGMGLVYLLARQLVRTAKEARALVAVMFALATVLAVFGFYQVLVSVPADRAAYAADPEQVMLRSLGQVYPEGSIERMRFEDRLRSTEPLATFALANSLAGFLAPWLVVALGIAWGILASGAANAFSPRHAGFAAPPMSPLRVLAFALAIFLVAACLLLTKSRSGYVALAAGIALVPFVAGHGQRRLSCKFVAACGSVLLAFVIVAAATGRLDIQVLSEASKSLGFRLQYWQATLAMIAHHLLLGVGPGNFQDYYTQFKLPQASEEIRDPHNFLLEVWATGGTLSLAALFGVLATLGWRVWNADAWATPSEPAADDPRARAERRNIILIVAGGGAGFLIAFVIGPLFGYVLTEGQVFFGLAVGGAVVAALWPWILRRTLSPRLAGLGVLVLAIHLLASGGIAFPGVAGTFWLLVALALNLAEGDAGFERHGARRMAGMLVPLVGFALACGAAVACHYTAYAPVLSLQRAMADAARVSHPQARIVSLLDATKADPLAADPWIAIAELELSQVKRGRASPAHYQHFLDVTQRILDLRPRSSATWRQVGAWYVEAFEHNRDPEAIKTAVDCLRKAVELYPNSAALRAELALALERAGRIEAARQQGRRALELDDEMPHADKKLPAETRQRLMKLADNSDIAR